MRYVQCLIQFKQYKQLRWLPERFAEPDNLLKINGLWGDSWRVKEVYTDEQELVKDSGKYIWDAIVEPYLEGDKLQERLKLYKKSIKLDQIKLLEDKYGLYQDER